MDSLTLLALAFILVTIFVLVNLLPTMLIKWRASALGLNLTYGQARIITKDNCNKKDSLLRVTEIWFWEEPPIEKLTNHYNAKGDLRNLRDGIIQMKQKGRSIISKYFRRLTLPDEI